MLKGSFPKIHSLFTILIELRICSLQLLTGLHSIATVEFIIDDAGGLEAALALEFNYY